MSRPDAIAAGFRTAGRVAIVGALGSIAALIVAGCVATPYLSAGRSNLHIRTSTGDRTVFAATNAAVEIGPVSPSDCRAVSEGKVYLKDGADALHLPEGRLSYLRFTFHTSSLFWQTQSLITYGTLLRPRVGYTYDAVIAYNAGLYSIDIFERTGSGPGRKLPRRDVSACKGA